MKIQTEPPPVKTAWSLQDANDLYHVEGWANGYFEIDDSGAMCVRLQDGNAMVPVRLEDIISGIRERGTDLPILLRFSDILDARIAKLNDCFNQAMADLNYQGRFRGVYPIKVNQQQQVIEEVTAFGARYHYGLEAGSKAELLAALAHMQDPEAALICNGYKDEEFITLVLYALKMGVNALLVVERPDELDQILACSRKLGIEPRLGVRIKLSSESSGQWAESAGETSVFGLTTTQVMEAVEKLRTAGMLDCLKMLHYHQGSQIPNISDIREAAMEASRIYAGLVAEGAPMGLLDMGGGLAVDYTGTQSETAASRNYSLEEYAADVVEIVANVCTEAGIPHPDIITESGRAIAAYYSVLIFNILDVNEAAAPSPLPPLPPDAHDLLKNLAEVNKNFDDYNLQELHNDAVYYRQKLRSLFVHGNISLQERACADRLYLHIINRIVGRLDTEEDIPESLVGIRGRMKDVYYGNFSVFQSLPDNWAIDQLFPIMPIHRLTEPPSRRAIITDITCDCDGSINKFVVEGQVEDALPLHPLVPGEEYMIGVFLVGAYQETLGDLHNLLGDTHVVSIKLQDGRIRYTKETQGDTVADVLTYVEYDPNKLVEQFRKLAEKAVDRGLLQPKERKVLMDAYQEGLQGYTYFESPETREP